MTCQRSSTIALVSILAFTLLALLVVAVGCTGKHTVTGPDYGSNGGQDGGPGANDVWIQGSAFNTNLAKKAATARQRMLAPTTAHGTQVAMCFSF